MKQQVFSRDFTLVVIGQIISLFGNAILHFALPLYLLRETGSSALFGVVTACSFLPMVILSPVGGAVADRVNKRSMMAGLDFFTAGLILMYTLIWGLAPLVPVTVVCLMLLYGIAGAYQPSVQASVPLLLPQESLNTGNAVINMVQTLANLLGPILGGILLSAWGLRPILWISILCFFASAVMELFIRIPHVKQPRTSGVFSTVWADLRESAQYIRRKKPVFLRVTLLLSAFNLILSAAMIVGIPVLVVNILKMSDASLGLTQGAMGLGGLLGGVLGGTLGNRLRPRHGAALLLICSGTLAVMGLVLFPGIPPALSYWTITVFSMLMMAAASLFSILLLSAIQSQVAPHLLGKVIACVQAAANCASPLGQAGYGVLFEHLPPCPILLGAALLSALIGLRSIQIFQALGHGSGPISHHL